MKHGGKTSQCQVQADVICRRGLDRVFRPLEHDARRPGFGSLTPSRSNVSHSAIITALRTPVGPVAASLIQNHSTYSIAVAPNAGEVADRRRRLQHLRTLSAASTAAARVLCRSLS